MPDANTTATMVPASYPFVERKMRGANHDLYRVCRAKASMSVDPERHQRIRIALSSSHLDLVVCSSPTEVLLLTGYWPVIGASIAVFSAAGDVFAIVPEDEAALAASTSSANIIPYRPATLERLSTPIRALAGPLSTTLKSLNLSGKTVGVEFRQRMQPASYAASLEYYGALIDLLESMHLSVHFVSSEPVLEHLMAKKTPRELELMRKAAKVAADGFARVEKVIHPGMRETDVAAEIQYAFDTSRAAEGLERSYGYFYCMSGPNSAEASAAYARTRQRRIEEGDLVLIHANTCADGYWTDITRTYTVGPPSQRQVDMRAAIEEARQAAMRAAIPGATGAEVDLAARGVMERHGLGEAFRHSTGHGVGFAAANANGLPRIHPKSPDVLDEGMTFNIEPAAYFDGYGGMRHCDVVAIGSSGVQVLTEF
jgi:Xaa-Pro aminopeptidase